MRITLDAINDELRRLGHDAEVAKADGYFYFTSGETASWLDRTVRVPTLRSLSLEQWVKEFERLKKLNKELLGGKATPQGAANEARGRKRARKK